MTVKSFFLTMGAGVAVGALGAMMLPKKQRRVPHDKAGRQGYSKRGGKGCGRDLLGHVSGKGFPETGSLFHVFERIDQNAFTAAVSAARALRYQPR